MDRDLIESKKNDARNNRCNLKCFVTSDIIKQKPCFNFSIEMVLFKNRYENEILINI